MALLPGLFASLAPNVQGVDITPSGEVLGTTTDRAVVASREAYFPSVAEYGLASRQPPLPVLPRSKLTVLKRIALGVDQVSYMDPQSGRETVAALKLPLRNPTHVGGGIWTDIHVLGRLPPHPNVVWMNALVVEEISGLGVVGYTMPFLDGYSLAHQPAPWAFKLKWLHEITDAVDFLNLKCGVLHADLVAVNIFINTATDSAVLIDLGMAKSARRQVVGGKRHFGCPTMWEEARPAADPQASGMGDVRCVILTILLLITQHRTTATGKWARESWKKDAGRVRNREEWVKHPDVDLDADISLFYDALMAWDDRRRDGPLPAGVPDPVTWPPYEEASPKDYVTLLDKHGYQRKAGRPILNWLRPPTSKLDPNRPILATGRYVDEEPATEFMQVPDPSRGFPQALLGMDGPKRHGATSSSGEVGGGGDTDLRRKRGKWVGH
ncbi:hypothetical protein B0T25DRAFT_442257 [Lasiosphaeria hispida]|uniref:Protein kinase domain-containing protein n=1 Tax=Lasiosphaeria hispida TaxID=260671 RepID=A0AAJ0MKQ1_9PEZI|nr:hypothetical protein B0T25DRAFT_442257 [Lasiosphaeria hispida]